jgi:hypothetical protein
MNYNLVQKFSALKNFSKNRLRITHFIGFYSFISLLTIVLCYNSSKAQSTVTFDAGQTFSKFKYSDSQGAITDFTNNISGCFSVGYNYIGQNGIIIRSNAGMRKGGASLVYNETNVDWNLQYTDLNIGAGYSFNRWMVKPYVVVLPYVAYMLKGEQKIGDNTYNVIKNKTMSTLDYGVCFVPGLKVALTNTVAFYAEYKQILGLQNLEVTSTNNQKTFNRGFSVNLGVAISFIKYNYVTTQ